MFLVNNTVTGSASTQYLVALNIFAALAQKLARSARIACCITDSGDIITDSFDVTAEGVSSNTVNRSLMMKVIGLYYF